MSFIDPDAYVSGEAHALGGRGFSARHQAFGAVGDFDPVAQTGADDTAALQKWIDNAEQLHDSLDHGARHSELSGLPGTPHDCSGVVCVLPAGNYRVSATLTLHRPLRLQGAGWNESVIHATGDFPILHYERKAETTQVRAVIRGIGFEGTHVKFFGNAGRANQHGVKVTKDPGIGHNNYIDIEDCQFHGLGGAGVYGFFTQTNSPDAMGDKFRIRGCHFALCGDFGIRLEGRHATAYISGNHIHDCAGGIALLGKRAQAAAPALPVSTSVIERNIIEGNATGAGAPGSDANPAVGIQLGSVFILRIERNYFEGHLNGVYLVDDCSGIQIVRNHFDGNDVNFPRLTLSVNPLNRQIERQLSPVYWGGDLLSDVVVEENDVYIPSQPAGTPDATWSPTGAWPGTYPVFPRITGYAHQLIRNTARLGGGEVQDATYPPAAEGSLYFESVAPYDMSPPSVKVRYRAEAALVRHRAGCFEHESSDAAAAVFHDMVYPAALPSPVRVQHALRARDAAGALQPRHVVSSIGDDGWTFHDTVTLKAGMEGDGWRFSGPPEHHRALIQVAKIPDDIHVTFHNLDAAPDLRGIRTSDDDAAGPLLSLQTSPAINREAGIQSQKFAVVQPGWEPEYTTSLVPVTLVFVRVWAGLFSGDPAASATPAVRLAGFRYDTGADTPAFWSCVTANGGAQTVTVTDVAFVPERRYTLRVRFRVVGTVVEFYVDDRLVATHTTHLPGPGLLGFANRVTTLSPGPAAIRVGRIALTHNA